jgi:F-type H+-transporting ATPase subunit gamma
MPNLKEVRNKISSVGSTMQITSAMKMVSAAKLKRAQDAVTQMRPYSAKLKEILENALEGVEVSENPYARASKVNSVLIISVSSNRGLAGAFNSNIIKKTLQLIGEETKGNSITVLPVGKKVHDAFKRTSHIIGGSDIPHHGSDLLNKLNFEETSAVITKVMEAYLKKQFDKVLVVYNQFKNAAVQVPIVEQLLPVNTASANVSASEKTSAHYIYEPNKEQIVGELIPLSIKTQFYRALLDSFASEHGARMTAMHKATDNAKSMQRDLKIMYNKARQAAITKEILEIVGGAEALKG